MSNAESAAPAGENSRAEKARRVQHELRRGKPPGADHPIWEYFSVNVKEAYKCFALRLLCDRLGRYEVLMEVFNMWGGGKNVLTYREGKRRQPQGFRPEQLTATALDPRIKILYGIEGYEHEGLWTIVSRRAAKIAGAKQADQEFTTVLPAVSGVQRAAHAASTSASERPRTGFMAASVAHADRPSHVPSPLSSQDATVERAVKEVEAFKPMPPLPMVEETHNGQEISPDTLQWWATRAHDFPLLAPLARRVQAIPASQAQSERLLSSAALIVMRKRNSRSADNVELLVSLSNSWTAVDAMKMSWGVAQSPVRIS